MPTPLLAEPAPVFAVLMLILLVAPALSARLRLPGVVGLIAAGALVGPSALNVIARSETIDSLGKLGLLYLMFLAGLSLDLTQFAALRTRSLVFGLLSFFLPQLLALVAGLHGLGQGWLAALLLGSICGTHTLVALPVAQRLGLGRHPAVTVVAGGTLVCDLLGLGILAAVAAAHAGNITWQFWLTFALKVSIFVAVVLVVLPRLARWFLRRVALQPATELTFLLVVLFGTAYLAKLAGLATLIGAFLGGLVLNRMVPAASGIMGRVTFVGEALFVPLFLVSVGMLVDVSVLTKSPRVWELALLFMGIVLVGKGSAALLAARAFGETPAAGWLMVGLSVPQAAGTLAVTLVGFELRLFDETVVNAVIVLILATCLGGPWLVDRAGRRAALEVEAAGEGAGDAGGRVIIPLANPATAGALVEVAILLREPGSTDPIHPLTVVRDGRDVDEQVARSERMLGEAVLHAVAAGAPVQPVTRVDLNVVHAMVRAAKELRAGMVVIGWTGTPSTQEKIFGGVLDQLLDQSPQMVLVCKTIEPFAGTERVILLAPPLADRQEGFDRAARAAKALARNLDARLRVFAHEADRARIEARLRELRPQAPFDVDPLDVLEAGAIETLARRVQPHDLLLALTARRDTLAWQPAVERLPSRISAAFPAHNIIVIHPAETPRLMSDVAEVPPDSAEGLLLELPQVQASLQRPARGKPLAVFVSDLLEPALSSRPDALDDVTARLLSSAEHPVEARPGMIFLHTHAAEWDEPRIFVATSEEGVVVPGLAHPAQVVVALVSPQGQSAEAHLRNLATVAQAFLGCDSVERLSQARTLGELRALLAADPP